MTEHAESVALTATEKEMLLRGLGWAVSEGGLQSKDVVDLVVKLGRSREDWVETYGPWPEFVCPVCGTRFVDDDVTAADEPLYCSDACTAAAHSAHAYIDSGGGDCEVCGRYFDDPQHNDGTSEQA